MDGRHATLGLLLGGLFLVTPLGCGKKASGGNDTGPAAATPSSDPNIAGLPIAIDPSARRGFLADQIYKLDDNGYPGCENPPQVDFGWTPTGGCPSAPIGTQLPMQSFCHMNFNVPVTWYQSNPPASGDHWPEPSHQLGDNKDSVVARESWVHSMEHGAIVLAYNCPDGCDAQVALMRQVVAARADRKYKVLMTRDPRLPANTTVAIAWTWIFRFDSTTLKTLLCFVDEHYDHARENDKVL